jgi:hypothetical protein
VTAQSSDVLIYEGDEYAIVEVVGKAGWSRVDLVHPSDFGMKGRMTNTANRKGFSATYEIVAGLLRLKDFGLYERDGNYLPIAGVTPDVVRDEGEEIHGHYGRYRGVGMPIAFMGTVRIASGSNDAREARRTHVPCDKTRRYTRVLDLELRAGHLVSVVDLLASGDGDVPTPAECAVFRY